MSHQNPFSDKYSHPESPKSNSGAVIVIVLAIVGGVVLLTCGGMFAGGVWLARQAQQDMEQFRAEFQQGEFQTDADLRRYNALHNSGRYEEALAELDKALTEHPDDAVLHNAKAWTLATCPDDSVRDGALAVEHGTIACDLTDWSSPAFVDTMAAAHAEAGDFPAAVQCQQEAIDLDPEGWYRGQFEERLELYKSNTPYREGVAPAGSPSDAPATEAPADSPANQQPANEREEGDVAQDPAPATP